MRKLPVLSIEPPDRPSVASGITSQERPKASLLGALTSPARSNDRGRFLESADGRAFLAGLELRQQELEVFALDMKRMADRSSSGEVQANFAKSKADLSALLDLKRRVRSGVFSDSEVAPFVREGRASIQIGAIRKRPTATWVDGTRQVDERLVSGEGGLSFVTEAPPGPGRLCRLPFYPSSDSAALSTLFFTPVGASEPMVVRTGIDEAGDDPILNVQIDPPFTSVRQSGPKVMLTRPLDYGRFRVIGLQTHEQPAYFADNASGAVAPFFGATSRYLWDAPPAITVSNLQTQNGRELFVTRNDQQMMASTYEICGYERTWSPPSATMTGPLQKLTRGASRWARRSSRFYAGLRDNPIIDLNTYVAMTVQAFVPEWPAGDPVSPPPATRLVIPFSAELIIEILEDEVLGDIINPSASARAGAQVNVGLRDAGVTSDGQRLLALVAPRLIPNLK